jgi:predicted RNA-binding Zn-ribbon protein involved in translation (DUF1610 family)
MSVVPQERLLQAVKETMFGTANIGFCRVCGTEVDGVEPDARGYECPECGAQEVYGAEELLLMS